MRLRVGLAGLLFLAAPFLFSAARVEVFSGLEGATASGKNWAGTGAWTNGFAKACKMRLTGLTLAPPQAAGGQSSMKRSVETPEPMVSLRVSCVASTASACKTHVLGVRLNGGELLTQEVKLEGKGTPSTAVFRWDDVQAVSTLELTNETAKGSTLFEVADVAWEADFPAIAVTPSFAANVAVGDAFAVSLEACSGGSGVYTRFVWGFDGETQTVDAANACVTFTAPETDGAYPLTLAVTDSRGITASFSWEIIVTPYTAARGLKAVNCSRTGLRLTWEQPGAHAVTAYTVTVRLADPPTVERTFMPEWEQVGGDLWQLRTPLALPELTHGAAVKSAYLVPMQWTGSALAWSLDEGRSWLSAMTLSGRWMLGKMAAGQQTLQVRSTGAPPPFFRLLLTMSDHVAERTLEATGAERACDFTGLPAGTPLNVTVTTLFRRDDGTEAPFSSEPLGLTLAAVPVPALSANAAYSCLSIAWPEEESSLAGEVVLHAAAAIQKTLPPGLYLTRVYLKGNAAAAEGEKLPAGKAVVLTNTSSETIFLNGAYAFRIAKTVEGVEKSYTWDFGLVYKNAEGESVRVFPYAVPAGGELCFYSAQSSYAPPAELQPNAEPVSTVALNYLTADYTLTLLHEECPVNTLRPELNAVVRLWDDSLTHAETYAVSAADTQLPALNNPWSKLEEDRVLARLSFARGPSAQLFYAGYLANLDSRVSRVWAEAFLKDGNSYSKPAVQMLWTRLSNPGLRLLFR